MALAEPYLSREWYEVVLAEAEDVNVLDNDNFIVPFVEECAIDNTLEVNLVSLGQEQQRLPIPRWSGFQPLPIWIFAYTLKQSPHCPAHLLDQSLAPFRILVAATLSAVAWLARSIQADDRARHIWNWEKPGHLGRCVVEMIAVATLDNDSVVAIRPLSCSDGRTFVVLLLVAVLVLSLELASAVAGTGDICHVEI